MNLNRELHEEFGYCWHEWEWSSENGQGAWKCRKCGKLSLERNDNPDYVADPRLVIREIAKQGSMLDERLKAFSMYVESGTHSKPYCISAHGLFELVAIDTTGQLARLALDWLREQKEEGI